MANIYNPSPESPSALEQALGMTSSYPHPSDAARPSVYDPDQVGFNVPYYGGWIGPDAPYQTPEFGTPGMFADPSEFQTEADEKGSLIGPGMDVTNMEMADPDPSFDTTGVSGNYAAPLDTAGVSWPSGMGPENAPVDDPYSGAYKGDWASQNAPLGTTPSFLDGFQNITVGNVMGNLPSHTAGRYAANPAMPTSSRFAAGAVGLGARALGSLVGGPAAALGGLGAAFNAMGAYHDPAGAIAGNEAVSYNPSADISTITGDFPGGTAYMDQSRNQANFYNDLASTPEGANTMVDIGSGNSVRAGALAAAMGTAPIDDRTMSEIMDSGLFAAYYGGATPNAADPYGGGTGGIFGGSNRGWGLGNVGWGNEAAGRDTYSGSVLGSPADVYNDSTLPGGVDAPAGGGGEAPSEGGVWGGESSTEGSQTGGDDDWDY